MLISLIKINADYSTQLFLTLIQSVKMDTLFVLPPEFGFKDSSQQSSQQHSCKGIECQTV